MADSLAPTLAPQPWRRPQDGETRRDFLKLVAGSFAAVGVGAVAWPFVNSMNPARDVLALSTTDVDLKPIAAGPGHHGGVARQAGLRAHRTEAEIKAARDVPLSELKDPQTDQARVKKDQWLVLIGICTHLGCVPLGQKPTDPRGDYGGWFCPCHGSALRHLRPHPPGAGAAEPGGARPTPSPPTRRSGSAEEQSHVHRPSQERLQATRSSAGSTAGCRSSP